MKKKVKKISKKLIVKHKDKIKEYLKKHKDEIKKIAGVEIPIAEYYYIGYKVLEVLKLQNDAYTAEELLERAIKVKQKAKYYYVLGMVLKKKKKWWQSVEALSKAIEFSDAPTAFWYKHYAEVLGEMNRFREASAAWEKAIEIGKPNSDWYFAYGDILKKANEETKSDIIFEKAIKLDKSNKSKELGIGIFYEKKGHWIESLKEYKKEAEKKPNHALITYKLGLSYDRCYDWKKAEEAYLDAILLSPESIDWYYRLGFVRERQENWKKASEAYIMASFKRKNHTPYWFYRLGYVLNKAEDYEKSCEAFLMMKKIKKSELLEETDLENEDKTLRNDKGLLNDLAEVEENFIETIKNSSRIPNDTTNLNEWNQLLKKFKKIKDYETVEFIYKEIIARTEEFNGNLYFELGKILVLQEKFKEASGAFIEQRIMQDAHGVMETPYNKNKGLKKVIDYTEYYERYKLEDEVVLYESYHGASISGNPYAIFKSLLKDERFKNFKHIWVINDKTKISQEWKEIKNIIFIKRNSDLYMRYLSKVKYLINNVTFPEYFIRKEKQIYLNTWHGIPIKTLGKDIKDDFMAHKNAARNFLQASHLIQPNDYTTKIMTTRFDIDGVFSGILAETGYPRQDLMLNITEKEKTELRKKIQITEKEKVILYAPTWRGTLSGTKFNVEKLLKDIKKISEIEGVKVVFRGHHMIEKLLKSNVELNNITVSSTIDTNTLLSIVDILITDYSSIAFDYMALKKPIIYYTYDRKEYEEERGLYFPLEKLGGELCNTQEELLFSLEKVIKNSSINNTQKLAQKKFCSHDDGKASNRVIDLIFFNEKKDINIIENSTKKSILLYGGQFIPNGITTSFLNLTNHIDKNNYNITIAIDPKTIENKKQNSEQLKRLNNNISIINKFYRMVTSLEEKWIIDKFNSQHVLATKEMWDIFKKVYKREFLKIFGHAKFDTLVNFEGYHEYWTRLFGSNKGIRKVIYLHNEMLGEAKTRFPYLYSNFQMYTYYNKCISVSTDANRANKQNLALEYNLNKLKLDYCDNLLNPEEVIERAKGNLEYVEEEKLFKDSKIFVNMARLSPEKDQEKLIYAFARLVKEYKKSKLIILGQGPLENKLKSLVKKLSMQNNIFILGQRFNPMPYLKKSDCFVLSSNYEGQGLVLLEAMILDKSVISTDIVGPRSVLEGKPGLLVENSEDGLYQGMLDFLEDRYIEEKTFDYEEYNQNALNMFYEKVVRDKIEKK